MEIVKYKNDYIKHKVYNNYYMFNITEVGCIFFNKLLYKTSQVFVRVLTMIINYGMIYIDWYLGNFRSPKSFFYKKELVYERI